MYVDWTNAFVTSGTEGTGMMSSQQPYLIQNGTGIVVVLNTEESYYFDKVGSNYVGEWNIQDKLAYTGQAQDQYIFTDSAGDQITFNGFFGANGRPSPAAMHGTFASFTDANGQVTSASYNSSSQLTSTTRSATSTPVP